MTTDTPMQRPMVGSGRIGANLARRLMRDGHNCVGRLSALRSEFGGHAEKKR